MNGLSVRRGSFSALCSLVIFGLLLGLLSPKAMADYPRMASPSYQSAFFNCIDTYPDDFCIQSLSQVGQPLGAPLCTTFPSTANATEYAFEQTPAFEGLAVIDASYTYPCPVDLTQTNDQNSGSGSDDGGQGTDNGGSGSGSGGNGATTQGCSCDGSPVAGDPINFSTGNRYSQEDDYPNAGWLTFRRFYNSAALNPGSNQVGANWSHSFSGTLILSVGVSPPTVTAMRPDGKAEVFTLGQQNQWIPNTPNIRDTLTETTTAGVSSYVLFVAALRHYETYNFAGLLQSVTDETGQGITLTYSTSSTPSTVAPTAGYLVTVTDPKGRELNFAYASNGFLTQVTLPDGGQLTYTYNAVQSTLTSVKYPDGSIRQYVYNESSLTGGANLPNAMTGIVDEAGVRYESSSYNASNQATGSSFAGNVGATQMTYGSSGTSTVQYPLGTSVTMGFNTTNAVNRVASLSQQCAPQCNQLWATRTYDANSRPATATDFKGNVIATTYNSMGLLTQKIEAKGQSSQRTTTTTWNNTLLVPLQRTVQDVNGNVLSNESWAYNTLGGVVARCQADPNVPAAASYTCAATGTVPAAVRRWTYTYCTAVGSNCPLIGLLLSATGPRTDLTQTTTYSYYTSSSAVSCGTPGAACYQAGDLHTVTDAMGHVSTIVSYDADGRVTRSTDANGVNSDTTYNARGWVLSNSVGGATTRFTYTPYGAVQTVTDPDGVMTTYGYDTAHRLNKITDALGNYTAYTLDAAGDKTAEQIYDSSGTVHNSLTRTFNALGQLTSIVDGLKNTVFNATASTSYDANGNLVQSTDGLGIQHLLGYDGLNRLVQTIDNYEGSDAATKNTTTGYKYSGLNQLVVVTDPNNLTTNYSFDGLFDPTGQTSPDTGTTSRTFDLAGDTLTHTDANGIRTTNTYDALNRLITSSFPVTSLNMAYHYDEPNSTTGCATSYPLARLTRIIETAVTTVYCYDARGNVTRKQQVTSAGTDTTTYTISAAGRLSAVTYPSGSQLTYSRDGDGRIQTMNLTPVGGASTTVVSAVTYQPFGPVSGYKLGNGQVIARTYDANYRLTDITSPAFTLHLARDAMGDVKAMGNAAGANPATETYSYSPLYQLTTVTEANGSVLESATYNQTGDRTSKTGSGLATGTYTYKTGTHQLTATGNAARTVDADGNTTAITEAGSTYGFGYNDRNRLTLAQIAGSTVGTYTYNALGQRIQKVSGSTTERYDYNEGNQLLGEYGTTKRDYVWMDGIPVVNVDTTGTTSTITYVTADHLNTPRAIANSSGTTIWQWAYQSNPWGELAPTSSSYTYNLRLPGQYFDAESGVMDNLSRSYDATVGRYMESDSAGLQAGISTYSYVGGNPLNHSDPLGLDDTVCMYNPSMCGMYAVQPATPPSDQNTSRNNNPNLLSNVGNGAGLGMLAGGAAGVVVVANFVGFPEVEIGEVAVAAIGADGVSALEFMDAIGGEPLASLSVGGIAGAATVTPFGGALGYVLTDPQSAPTNYDPVDWGPCASPSYHLGLLGLAQ